MKILFFAPAFFNYEQTIKNKMQQMGAEVALHDERAVSSAFERSMLKICPATLSAKADKYYEDIINKHCKEKFDYIVIVKADMVSVQTIKKLRKAFPEAKLCLHIWDSAKNIKGIVPKIALFDHATSFDRQDCGKIEGLKFRPLFFADDFANKEQSKDKKYDLCFCGTIHSDRYAVLSKLQKQAEELGLKFYGFYYLQARFMYYFYKAFGKGFRNAKMSEFAFDKKPLSELAEIEDASNVIVDIQHPAQTGLTMRTIEMIGLKKKIITTNADIKNYDFYNPASICIIDRENPVLDKAFFETPYQEIPQEVYNRYSLEQWVKDVLGLEDTTQ